MGIFRHTPDNDIWINNTVMPLSFFITLVPTYTLPAGAISQWYQQGVGRVSSNGPSGTNHGLVYIDGNTFIANEVAYAAAYAAYLNPAPTLPQEKAYKIAEMEQYALTKKDGYIIMWGNEYFTNNDFFQPLVNEDITYNRIRGLPAGYYLNDVNYNQIEMTSIMEFETIIDQTIYFYGLCGLNIDAHRVAINALASVPAVIAYDYTIGWPTVPYNRYLTFNSTYYSSINADYAGGSPTGWPEGGATILNHKLDLAYNDTRYVDYNAVASVDSRSAGTISFDLTPNYSGTPITTDMTFFTITEIDTSVINMIKLSHSKTTGGLILVINNIAGANIINVDLGSPWNPIAGTEYNFILHYDLVWGNTFVRVDRVLYGTVQSDTGNRTTGAIGLFRVGSSEDSTNPTNSNFSIRNLQVCSY